MKKVSAVFLFFIISFLICGAGYKGTLPDLNRQNEILPVNNKQKQADILPLDKLTLPVLNNEPVDTIKLEYIEDVNEILRRLGLLQEVLTTDKSFKNFVAGANVLDLVTDNFLQKYPDERFKFTNEKILNINYDTQQIKDYWIKINKNAPYVSYYTTEGAYSGAVLNEQLNNFSKVLKYAITDIKKDIDYLTRVR